MARTSTKAAVTEDTVPVTNTVSREEFDNLVAKNNELTEMLQKLLATKNEPVVTSTTETDDGSWTLVHLQDCDPRLPDSFTVNGKTHYFTTFGETKKFPRSELGDIVAQCRNYFTTGVLALGSDCERYRHELPADIFSTNLPDSFFKNMTNVDDETFERNISKLTESQIAHVACVWKNRYFQRKKEYRNKNKIKVLNRCTNGLLKVVLDDLNSD